MNRDDIILDIFVFKIGYFWSAVGSKMYIKIRLSTDPVLLYM